VPLLVCPDCKSELIWDIKEENETHIINAEIQCGSCKKVYFIEDSVACFLSDDDKAVTIEKYGNEKAVEIANRLPR
jgi:uncharacterized protein YbaR (Trm112 family)